MTDQVLLSELKIKGSNKAKGNDVKVVEHSFILMGTPEEDIFVDPCDRDDLPEVIDDFDLDFNAGSDEWVEHAAKDMNLKKVTDNTTIHIMNHPRPNKPLMVLDLDHTLLDFSSKRLLAAHETAGSEDGNGQGQGQGVSQATAVASASVNGHMEAMKMKRPYMDEFLTNSYRHYDLVVWSQTSWRWLETKLIELGMLTNPGYKFCFVLDKTSMFAITSTKRSGKKVKHYVKPLQIIWSKFPQWNTHNTVHLDDLSRNFALNLNNGLKVTAFYRKRKGGASTGNGARDAELVGLSRYLQELATSSNDFAKVDFGAWMDVVSGRKRLLRDDGEDENDDGGGKKRSA